MSQEVYKDWIEYYRAKGIKGGNLREVSGYIHGLAQITEVGLEDITNTAKTVLGLNSADRLLDIGCGAGLITQELVGSVGVLVGLDASHEMLMCSTQDCRFDRVQAMADSLPFNVGSFNKVFCHSIFQYFPNHQYAAKVIAEMLRVMQPGGRCLIMDIPDISKKEDYIRVKTSDSNNLQRIFYDKELLRSLAPNVSVFEREITDYGNSRFRFNVLIVQ